MAAGDADRQGGAHRLDADADAPERRARHGADHRAGPPDRHGQPAARRSAPSAMSTSIPIRGTSSPARWSSPSTSARPTSRRSTACGRRLEAEAPKIAADLGLGIEIEPVGHFDPVTFDADCVKAVRDAADRLGYSHRDIISGAGHDACWINRVAPTAMVMCPCVDGLSHNEDENISKEWATAGADVLLPRGGRDRGDRRVSIDRQQIVADIYEALNRHDMEVMHEHLAPEVDWANGIDGGREHSRAGVQGLLGETWKDGQSAHRADGDGDHGRRGACPRPAVRDLARRQRCSRTRRSSISSASTASSSAGSRSSIAIRTRTPTRTRMATVMVATAEGWPCPR